MLIEGIDYFVRFVPFPYGTDTHGMVMPNDDGTFSIYIDINATEEQQKRAYAHEICHLDEDDLYGDKDIVSIECALERKKTALEDTPKTVSYIEQWEDAILWIRFMMHLYKGQEELIPAYPGFGRW